MSSNPQALLAEVLDAAIHQQASDVYFSVDVPPTLRINGRLMPLSMPQLTGEIILDIMQQILDAKSLQEYKENWECNLAIHWRNKARFRVNAYRQQLMPGMVLRRIQTKIPTCDELSLPEVYQKMIMQPRGLILVAGPVGSGKTSAIAAMIGYRNQHGTGHIITIEDPIEFVHRSQQCIITQRDVGMDTHSHDVALKNALRQSPDVVMIGELRDRETMDQALKFAETGHLCIATVHANNAYQTIERIVTMFPEEKHAQVLQSLSLNLRAIFSQRLVESLHRKRMPIVEILLNEGLISSLIAEGKIAEIREIMERNSDIGMCTFDGSLVELYKKGLLSEDQALTHAENTAVIRMRLQQIKSSK